MGDEQVFSVDQELLELACTVFNRAGYVTVAKNIRAIMYESTKSQGCTSICMKAPKQVIKLVEVRNAATE